MALLSERNDASANKHITRVAKAQFPRKVLDVFFEHGQWWVMLSTGAIYSVVDAEGPGTRGGLDFEQVSEGEED